MYPHRRHPKDVVRCPACREELIPQVLRTGYAALWCSNCRTLDVIYPRLSPDALMLQRGVTGPPGVTVVDQCVICGHSIETVVRRGTGGRITMCDRHSVEERDSWRAKHKGLCIDGCGQPAACRGRCMKDYLRWWRKMGLEKKGERG